MPYLVLIVLLLAALLVLGRVFVTADPRRLARAVKIAGVALGTALAIYLLVAGRLAIGSFLLALMPLLLRWRAFARAMKNARGPKPGAQSEVSTRYLRVRLDHDTGAMTGTILQGDHRGRELRDLTTAEIVVLLAVCRVEDPQAVPLLETYLDRIDPEWRTPAAGPGEPPRPRDGPMSVDEAYRILGLAPGADAAEVRRAHRDLMLKVHPDRGGSDYLAAKINEAKDVLLRT